MPTQAPSPSTESAPTNFPFMKSALVAVVSVWLLGFLPIAIFQWLAPPAEGAWLNAGTFGDTFGAVNALFSAFAVLGVIYALILQRREFKHQLIEARDTRIALEGQLQSMEDARIASEDANRQQLLELHRTRSLSAQPFVTVKLGHSYALYPRPGSITSTMMPWSTSEVGIPFVIEGFLQNDGSSIAINMKITFEVCSLTEGKAVLKARTLPFLKGDSRSPRIDPVYLTIPLSWISDLTVMPDKLQPVSGVVVRITMVYRNLFGVVFRTVQEHSVAFDRPQDDLLELIGATHIAIGSPPIELLNGWQDSDAHRRPAPVILAEIVGQFDHMAME